MNHSKFSEANRFILKFLLAKPICSESFLIGVHITSLNSMVMIAKFQNPFERVINKFYMIPQ